MGAALVSRILHTPAPNTHGRTHRPGGTPGLWLRKLHLNMALKICFQGWHLQCMKHLLPLEKRNQWASIVYI